VGLNGTVVSVPQTEHLTCVSGRTSSSPGTFGLASFAVLGEIGESTPLKKLLFSRRKHELRTAGVTLEVLVGKFHEGELPLARA
jgi:hypothetical protein